MNRENSKLMRKKRGAVKRLDLAKKQHVMEKKKVELNGVRKDQMMKNVYSMVNYAH